MSEKLLPCPFCGGEDLRENKKCVGCACGVQGPYDTEDNISAWNDRAAQREVARTDLDRPPPDTQHGTAEMKRYGWRTIWSWLMVDSRNLACHQLWAAYRWERDGT